MDQTKENETSASGEASSQSTSNHDRIGRVFNETVKAAAIFLARSNDKEKRKKRCSSDRFVHNPDKSGIRRLQDDPKESEWWHLLQKKTIKDPNSRDGMAFHRDFCLPHKIFEYTSTMKQSRPPTR